MAVTGNMSYGSAFLSLLENTETAELVDFANRMLVPAIIYPLVVFVVTTIAGSGLVKGIYYFPETVQKVLADFRDAVYNMQSDFEKLRVANMKLLIDELNDHIAGFADLVSDAVWTSNKIDLKTRAGVSALNSTIADVVELQTELENINQELGTAAEVFDNVTERFFKERLDLLAFKKVCTTPLFCDRINADVFLLNDVNSRTLNIDSRVKEATDILESGLLGWINNSTYLFEQIGYVLQDEIYNNFTGEEKVNSGNGTTVHIRGGRPTFSTGHALLSQILKVAQPTTNSDYNQLNRVGG
ncbi:hypothetical protein RvY_17183 [Ramazzottius varieornatus]|uniref:Uncharacterized protein n=1 Tax=Ramazzottius varieornatus TaxID=947166 RepID=A0A1D1W192_RAMVA|nr:hypothetical protein RvY_17183 [Ramazzottius varieornatus]